MPKSVVVNPYFDWEHDRPPRTPTSDSVIYEMHVRGFSNCQPGIRPLRGTYGGLAHPVAIAHLNRLGITAVELIPVHQGGGQSAGGTRPAQLLGLQHLDYFAPDVAHAAAGANVVRNSSGW